VSQLETDERLLIPKARAALERYGHQVVIGNDLHTRKMQVVFVERKRKPLPPLPPGAEVDDAEADSKPEATQAQPVATVEASDDAEESVTPSAEAEPETVVESGTGEAALVFDVNTNADAKALADGAQKAAPPPPPPKPQHAHENTDEESMTFVESWLRIAPPATAVTGTTQVKEIEEDIVTELVRRHKAWIDDVGH
jgi:phosphopantothenate-cysteine ligase